MLYRQPTMHTDRLLDGHIFISNWKDRQWELTNPFISGKENKREKMVSCDNSQKDKKEIQKKKSIFKVFFLKNELYFK